MLDTGSGPNIIKENFISKGETIDYTKILKLNGISEYPVYTLGEITLPLFGVQVNFHIVSNDFPISQAGILGNDFFKQTSSKIDYAKGYLIVSGINVPFLSPEVIIVPPRSESLFYVRVENPEIKVGYIPRLKIAYGIHLGDTLVENVSGKAYLKVISTLDKEIEVQVPTLRLKPLNELFNNHELNNETRNNKKEVTKMQTNIGNDDAPCEISDGNNKDKAKVILNSEGKKSNEYDLSNPDNKKGEVANKKGNILKERKTKRNIENKIVRRNKNENFDLDIREEEIFTPSEILEPKILGEGSYQTSSKSLSDL